MTMTTFYQPGSYPTTLGRGFLRIKRSTDTVWQDLFHVKEFKINVATEELKHESMRSALKRVDKSIITKMEATGSFICDTPAVDNVKLFLLGNAVTTSTQTSGTWTAQDFAVTALDYWQDLGKRVLTITSVTKDGATVPTTGTAGTNTGNGTCTAVTKGIAIQNGTYTLTCTATATDGGTFSVTAPDSTDLGDATVGTPFTSTHINFTINDGSTDFALADSFTIAVSGTTTLVAGTDYLVDTNNGMFLPLSTSTNLTAAGAAFSITGTYAQHSMYQVKAGATSEMKYEIMFAGDPATGIRQVVYVYAVLAPEGDLGFIGDEWQGFSYKFTTQSHATYGDIGVMYQDMGVVANA